MGEPMSVQFTAAPTLPGWLSERFSCERRLALLGDEQLHFVDQGTGPVVLLMHGNPTWSFLWRKVVGELPDCRCIAPDLLGLGMSSKLPTVQAHQLERHIDAITQLILALEIDSFVVAGQDWGGPIGAGVAMRLPDRVRGMVWGNTGVVVPRRPLRTKAFHRFSHLPVVSDLAFRGLNLPARLIHRVQGDPKAMDRWTRQAYRWPLQRLRDRAAPLGLARMVPDSEQHPSIALVDAIGGFVESWDGPAGLVWGTRDPILGRGLCRHRAVLPQARVWETEAGHFSQEEVPDAWAEAIRTVVESAAT